MAPMSVSQGRKYRHTIVKTARSHWATTRLLPRNVAAGLEFGYAVGVSNHCQQAYGLK